MEIPKELKPFTGDLELFSKDNPEVTYDVISIIGKFLTLKFGAKFKKVDIGPVVKTYFFEPYPTAILSTIMGKEENIAMGLGVESVILSREKQYVTIAVPRKNREIINFKDSLFKLMNYESDMILPILLGKNPKGEEIYEDLAAQPHMLIGGATNSGKSVFTSQLIASLALFHSPGELELSLVDTKQLDLVLFDGLAHIKNVIKDIHDLRVFLELTLNDIRARNTQMSGIARNIKEWNTLNIKPYKYKIVIIDEFADIVDADIAYLKTLAPAARPQSIQVLVKSIAQIARAAGVHLIVATQRPSVKVIPGDLKTNFPCRIAFKLPSMQDSRVILDENGAEKLLGMGDFLYKSMGSDQIKRAHSAYVSMHDIATIVEQSEFLRSQYVSRNNN